MWADEDDAAREGADRAAPPTGETRTGGTAHRQTPQVGGVRGSGSTQYRGSSQLERLACKDVTYIRVIILYTVKTKLFNIKLKCVLEKG